jgi:SAM-dependent methyltransferase
MSRPFHQEPYDAHAAGYADHVDPTLASAADRLTELAGARRGIKLLDLATGTGVAARAAARRGASVIGVDRSPGMLEAARELSPGIDLRLADAYELPFDRGTFDAVTCGLSLSHFAEGRKALREVLRVLRPSGKFIASSWGEGSSLPSDAVDQVLDRYAGAVERLDEETWLSVERGSAALRDGGFAILSIETEFFTGSFSDVEEALRWSLAWPLATARVARLDPSRREQFVAEAQRALEGADLSWRFAFNFYIAQPEESR